MHWKLFKVYRRFLWCLAWASVTQGGSSQSVIINEVVAISSDHRLDDSLSSDSPRLGQGVSWRELAFDDSQWLRGVGPFGFRHGGLRTDLEEAMKLRTPSLYLRSSFSVTSDQIEEAAALQLSINYDDAFVAYLNGRELGRRNLGPAGLFIYADQSSFNKRSLITPEVLTLDSPRDWLRPGTNVLAIQVHSAWPPQDSTPKFLTLLLDANLHVGTTASPPVIASTNEWNYFIGLVEPSGSYVDHEILDTAPKSAAFGDWIELRNQGATDVYLGGWSLTDDPDSPRQWVFPPITLGAGEYLTVFCSGLNRALAGQSLHTNFKLDDQGEYVGLFDNFGVVVHELAGQYPPQSPFYTYGWHADLERYVYFSTATPGAANRGAYCEAICEKPQFSVEAGFHANPVTVKMKSFTLGGEIRYTIDGTEPTQDNGNDYAGPVILNTNTTLRARVYRHGWIPSSVRTATYLVAQDEALRSLPALLMGADPRRAVYEPEGVTTIAGGTYIPDGLWKPLTEDDYNMATMYGQGFERPASFEWLDGAGGDYIQVDAGMRLAGSPWSRPRMLMLNLEDTVWNNDWPNKPSFSFFFRNDYGADKIKLELVPGAPFDSYESLRLRAGKNDWANPFIRDEVVRRLFNQMGQRTSQGRLCNLFINGRFKGYFNVVERLREPFFQNWTGSTNQWDVRLVDAVEEGDEVQWNLDMAYMRSVPLEIPVNYQEASRRFDLVNFADYLVLNAYCAMWDWPLNNWYAARERIDDGQWRFQVWDAEGSFGAGTSKKANYNTIENDLTMAPPFPVKAAESIPVLYSALAPNPEFRMLFADRLQAHLFGEGVLTSANVLSNYVHLRDLLDPTINYVRNQSAAIAYLLDWVEDRPAFLLQHCRAEGLWPETLAPEVEPAGQILQPDSILSLVNPNQDGDIYYRLDGLDPRATGGGVAGDLYEGPVMPAAPVWLKARVLRNGEWSPLLEVPFRYGVPQSLVISEINYAPVGNNEFENSDFEFVEIQNAGPGPVDLTGVEFTEGISFTFTNGPILAPGAHTVVVSHPAAFASRYPGQSWAGVFTGQLKNGGERVTLSFRGTEPLFSVDYHEILPWPVAAFGRGFTLVPSGGLAASPDDAAYWRASALPGGSPGAADPEPVGWRVRINEILPRTDSLSSGSIELFNPGTEAVDVSGWYLSNAGDDPFQFQIPANSQIAAGSYFVLSQPSLLALPGAPASFLSATGGLAGLFSSIPSGGLSGYSHFVEYGASLLEMPQGYHWDSLGQEQFVPLSTPTLGTPNAPPRVGPVVINEIYYDSDDNACRFIELLNLTNQTMALFHDRDPTLVWRLDGVNYDFPPGTTLDPGEMVLIAECDPDVLRIQRDIPPSVRIFGPWRGGLDRGGEWLRLEKPDLVSNMGIELGVYVPVDLVRFNDKEPWPLDAAGRGASLQRNHPVAFGNDPNSWYASSLTPGRSNTPLGVPEPTLRLTSPGEGELHSLGEPISFQVDIQKAPSPVASVDYYLDGARVGQSTTAPYQWTHAPERGIHTVRAKVRFEPGLEIYSPVVSIQVLRHKDFDTVLIPFEAVWKFDDRGLDLSNTWVSVNYDDSSWAQGPAQLGYGEGDEATVIGFGLPSPNRNVTAYFRHAWTVPAELNWDQLLARLVRDDGAVIHVNGQEAARSNMPDGPIHYRTQASGASPEENAPVTVALDSSLVVAGLNQVAIEIHQVHRSSPDLSFALELIARETLTEPWITRQPEDVRVPSGGSTVLEVDAIGGHLHYQWYEENDQPVPGANGPRLNLEDLQFGDDHDYYAIITNELGWIRSDTAFLRVFHPDGDFDGMPDYWEDLYGFDPRNPQDANEDADGDGISNREEYMQGTDPRVVNQTLAIQPSVENGSTFLLTLQFGLPAAVRVDLQFARDLVEKDWMTVDTFGPWPTNSHREWRIPLPFEGGFYRLKYESSN